MEKKKVKIPPTFWSKAYLVEEDPGTFILYRDMLVEGVDRKTQEKVREKVGRPIPVGKPLRRAAEGEEMRVVVRTVHPKSGEPIDLVEIES